MRLCAQCAAGMPPSHHNTAAAAARERCAHVDVDAGCPAAAVVRQDAKVGQRGALRQISNGTAQRVGPHPSPRYEAVLCPNCADGMNGEGVLLRARRVVKQLQQLLHLLQLLLRLLWL